MIYVNNIDDVPDRDIDLVPSYNLPGISGNFYCFI